MKSRGVLQTCVDLGLRHIGGRLQRQACLRRNSAPAPNLQPFPQLKDCKNIKINAVLTLYENGWSKLKFYFICGLPTETLEDMDEMAELLNKIKYRAKLLKREKGLTHGFEITCTLSIFVPKPFTPFQWAPQCTKEEFLNKAYQTRTAITKQLNQKSIKYNYHEADASVLEGVLARGDRRLNEVILKVYQKGCIYDAWGEYYKNDVWLETFEECGIDINFYTTRERSLDEIFPWDFIDCGVTKEFLKKEWLKAQKEEISENCKLKCQGCGAARFGGGICFEPRTEG